jgi:predicted RNA-binding Zn ribbon-like protein
VDGLATVSDLDEFLHAWRWSGSRAGDDAELAAVRALRPTLERMWRVGEDEAVSIVNDLLREYHALPQLVDHDGWGYHVHATPQDAPLAARVAVEAAMAFVDVIRGGQLDRLRTCAADDCQDVHVDLSKNRSRRFCSTGCANRTNVAAYRARKAGAGGR